MEPNRPLSQVKTQAAEQAGQHSISDKIANHSVLRNTYMLLSMTLLFAAGVAGAAMTLNLPHPGLIITLVGYFGLLFAVEKTKNSGLGLVFCFALTGFMGYTLGPILNAYLTFLPNGEQIVMMALGGTGTIFVGLSAYVLATGGRYQNWGMALMVGILVAFLCGIGAIVFNMPTLSLAVSAMFVILMAGLIMYQTGEIIHGGETNYISATVTLFVSIYNLFLSLMHLLAAFSGDD